MRKLISVVTPLGWTVLSGSAGAWLLGWQLGWIELILAAATGLGTFVLCALFTIGRTDLGIVVEPQPRRLTAGQLAKVVVTVTNKAKRRLWPLALEVAVGRTIEPFDLPGLAGGGIHEASFDLPVAKRGVVPVGPATSVRGDPLGLLQRRYAWTGVTELFVHPATIRLAPLGAGLLRDLEGQTTNDMSMSDLAFHTLREYVPGDDRRYIHWRSSAKVSAGTSGGRFLVRQFRDTRRTHLLVVIDGDAASYPDPEDFETAVSVGASVAVQAIQDELEATVVVADRWTRKETGQRQTRQRILDTCARAELGRTGLAELVPQGIRLAPGATFALIVTGANPSFATLRRRTAHLPAEVRVTAVRVDPTDRPGLSGSPLRVLTVTALGDLRRLLSRGDAG
jgi:uncharacterized protein (DUF58 family)